jgi:hypothetical protein
VGSRPIYTQQVWTIRSHKTTTSGINYVVVKTGLVLLTTLRCPYPYWEDHFKARRI